jgi:hypothetical protein
MICDDSRPIIGLCIIFAHFYGRISNNGNSGDGVEHEEEAAGPTEAITATTLTAALPMRHAGDDGDDTESVWQKEGAAGPAEARLAMTSTTASLVLMRPLLLSEVNPPLSPGHSPPPIQRSPPLACRSSSWLKW